MTSYTWPDGDEGVYLHQLHCRKDRCGPNGELCGCPHHHGVRMRLTRRQFLAGWLRLLRARLGGAR